LFWVSSGKLSEDTDFHDLLPAVTDAAAPELEDLIEHCKLALDLGGRLSALPEASARNVPPKASPVLPEAGTFVSHANRFVPPAAGTSVRTLLPPSVLACPEELDFVLLRERDGIAPRSTSTSGRSTDKQHKLSSKCGKAQGFGYQRDCTRLWLPEASLATLTVCNDAALTIHGTNWTENASNKTQ